MNAMLRNLGLTAGLLLPRLAGVLVDDAGEVDTDRAVNLADLRDGESRVFGRGEHELVATRQGERVRIRHEGGPERLDLTCDLKRETCKVLAEPDSDQGIVIVERRDSGGHRVQVRQLADGGESGTIVIHSESLCGGDADCETLDLSGEGPRVRVLKLRRGDAAPRASSVVLRCPEGDTTMRVDAVDADAGYTCPKHGVRLEPRQGIAF
ncbi:MAG TPA: hypothetical protein VJS92_18755 [Candidatus Polarisedimenticolaceae bacterium]|nr:hypothetical protein [Candidatus Polarisedimenticolaceae bacterium]